MLSASPTDAATAVAPAPRVEEPLAPVRARRPSRPSVAAAVLAIAIGVGLRAVTFSDLWLDEALSVNIASLPLGELREALQRDGSPPLYYFLLHVWMSVFGNDDLGVRALSTVFSVASLPLMWLAARRHGGRDLAVAALLLLASSPFAIRYGSEARMYALLTFLALAGYLLASAAVERPTIPRLGGVALVSGLLALTHYWSFYVLAVAGAALAVTWLRRRTKDHLKVLGALVAGGVLFLPWLPTFLYQVVHTGTPWAGPATPNVLVTSFDHWAGGYSGVAPFLSLVLFALVLMGAFVTRFDGPLVRLAPRIAPRARVLALLTFGPLALGAVVGLVLGTGFSERYSAPILPFFVLLAALGVAAIGHERARRAVLAAVVVLGLVMSVIVAFRPRTQAGVIAEAIATQAAPGDVVVYCPDQLGPAVSRLLPAGLDELTYPAATSPEFVDWVDYEERNDTAHPGHFARSMLERAGDRPIWLVTSPGYRTLAMNCERMADLLGRLRTRRTIVFEKSRYFEGASLIRYTPR